jgi:hypothetical protein
VARVRRYQVQEEILQERNSFSKTDPDATFMRTKDDVLNKGQLKPCYNIQISTENQIVTHYSVHQSPTDPNTFIEHLNGYQSLYGELPKTVIADAAYGSEENYDFLAHHQIEAVVKYSGYFQEQKKGGKEFKPSFWRYDQDKDIYFCPQHRPLFYSKTMTKPTTTGYEQVSKRYICKDCSNCPVHELCKQSEGNKEIQIGEKRKFYQQKAAELLATPRGRELSKRRSCEVETFFGQTKHNQGFRRVSMRGFEKVETEIGLLAVVYNLKKLII